MTRRITAAAMFLVACALLVPAPAAAGQKKAEKGAATSSGRLNVPAGPTYIIAPGDVLDISVWKEPDLSFRGLPVRPDGKISLPLINDVQAAGLTAMQLANSVTQRLKKYVEDPLVTVVVTEVNSQRYYVLGEVAHAGVFPLLPGITVLQALSAAGGFTEFANPKKIYILRNENGGQQKFPFNYKDVVAGKNLNENIQLRPGDTIIVP
ncbi:MAG: polysaccharide biosynthesis/export family protein [Terriglobia bacterium]